METRIFESPLEKEHASGRRAAASPFRELNTLKSLTADLVKWLSS